MAYGYHIAALYFDFRRIAGHRADCSRHGTDVWEVTRQRDYGIDEEIRKTVIRLACTECGVLHFESTEGGMSTQTSNAAAMGYGSEPIRESGLWLWPGPPLLATMPDRGPDCYYVTREKIRPASPDDVDGVVGQYRGPRGGIRWQAGTGCTRWGVKQGAPDSFTSRRAAVKWIAAELGIRRGDQ